jgi:acyl carrier protein
MSDAEIRGVIKQAIAKVTKIDASTIDDCASFRDDLGLDSLSILEAIVEVECHFQIAEATNTEEYATLKTVDAAARFVQRQLCLEAV